MSRTEWRWKCAQQHGSSNEAFEPLCLPPVQFNNCHEHTVLVLAVFSGLDSNKLGRKPLIRISLDQKISLPCVLSIPRKERDCTREYDFFRVGLSSWSKRYGLDIWFSPQTKLWCIFISTEYQSCSRKRTKPKQSVVMKLDRQEDDFWCKHEIKSALVS